METIDCVFCCPTDGSIDPVAIRENGWDGRQCKRCGLIYISPCPTLDEIASLYGNDSAHTNAAVLVANGLRARMSARHSLSLLAKYVKGGDLLEIGAGAGFFMEEAARAGFRTFGVELNQVLADRISALGLACASRPFSQAYPGRQFDVIYHCDVTSHFHDLIAEFRSMAVRLKPGGILMFETGNVGDLNPRWYRLITSFQYPDHLFFLSAANIPVLLERSGFCLLRVHHYSRFAELLIGHLYSKVRQKREVPSAALASSNHSAPREVGLSTLKPILRFVKSILLFVLTYYLGAVCPPRTVPQTMIAIAKKTGSAQEFVNLPA